MVDSGKSEFTIHRAYISFFYLCPFQEVPSIFPCEWQEERLYPVEASGPEGDNLGTWALKSDQTLMLGVRRAHLAQRIEDLEWELSLLLQVTDGSVCVGGSWPSLGRH